MELPQTFKENMQKLLGAEYRDYLESFCEERVYGLRVNTAKISVTDFLKICPFELKPIPWIENGFYYNGTDKPAKHPYYFAGLYYLQEPSAMTPANRLPVEAGDRILDLCAAPGGKSTELGAKLNGSGLLITNDISNSRAKALLKNVELFGLTNAVVLSEAPFKLEERFGEYFDKILIDAPCSGEGMFRKESAVMKAWMEKDDPNGLYSKLQREILSSAVGMLKPGGMMIYSTCTFSPLENEETILWLLRNYPEFRVIEMEGYEGFAGPVDAYGEYPELKNCVRIWPHKMAGEGHFVTLLAKGEPTGESHTTEHFTVDSYPKGLNEDFIRFMEEYIRSERFSKTGFTERNGHIHYIGGGSGPNLAGLRVMRNGLLMGECLKKRFEPSEALAMALKMEEFRYSLSLPCEDERVIRYLKGETIGLKDEERERLNAKDGSWILFGTDGYPLGFAKLVGGNLKNKYLPGWRWQ